MNRCMRQFKGRKMHTKSHVRIIVTRIRAGIKA